MFKKSIFALLLLLMSVGLFARTDIWGANVSGDWELIGSPFYVHANIWIDRGDVLTIEPGVVIYYLNNAGLTVYGQLFAGSDNSPSVIMNSGRGAPGWNGIIFNYATHSVLINVNISDVRESIAILIMNNSSNIEIHESLIHRNIANVSLYYNGSPGVTIHGSSNILIRKTRIYDNETKFVKPL